MSDPTYTAFEVHVVSTAHPPIGCVFVEANEYPVLITRLTGMKYSMHLDLIGSVTILPVSFCNHQRPFTILLG